MNERHKESLEVLGGHKFVNSRRRGSGDGRRDSGNSRQNWQTLGQRELENPLPILVLLVLRSPLPTSFSALVALIRL